MVRKVENRRLWVKKTKEMRVMVLTLERNALGEIVVSCIKYVARQQAHERCLMKCNSMNEEKDDKCEFFRGGRDSFGANTLLSSSRKITPPD